MPYSWTAFNLAARIQHTTRNLYSEKYSKDLGILFTTLHGFTLEGTVIFIFSIVRNPFYPEDEENS
jgi:hypothetical protein